MDAGGRATQEQLPSVTSMDGGNVVKMPGAFTPYSRMGVKAVVLSFEEAEPTERHHMDVVAGAQHHGWVVTLKLTQII
jgi:hypothetical protein